ncbi:hypothetical protein T08_4121 [Trichinella sp. T8]|nr:hypothetical protein T08_4121 [Trichinella sp. T8]
MNGKLLNSGINCRRLNGPKKITSKPIAPHQLTLWKGCLQMVMGIWMYFCRALFSCGRSQVSEE